MTFFLFGKMLHTQTPSPHTLILLRRTKENFKIRIIFEKRNEKN